MRELRDRPAPLIGRRSFLFLTAGLIVAPLAARTQGRTYRIGFANLTEDAGARIEGLGFSGADVRAGFVSAARGLPIDLVLYNNDRNRQKAIANADDAVARKLDLYVQYCGDPVANGEVAKRLKTAGIPVLAIAYPVPGAPLYGPDNSLAGKLAGDALAGYANTYWKGKPAAVAIVGDLGNEADHVPERVEAIAAALKEHLAAATQTRFDSNGNPAQADAQIRRFAAAQSAGTKLLIAALDDTTALMAKTGVEVAGRAVDTAIVGHGCDRSIHGGAGDKREIDPSNRASIIIGTVAYFLDRYGYDVLPLALKLLKGETVPARVATDHQLVTAANVFTIYPPIDMN